MVENVPFEIPDLHSARSRRGWILLPLVAVILRRGSAAAQTATPTAYPTPPWTDAQVADDISIDWTGLQRYPASCQCPAG